MCSFKSTLQTNMHCSSDMLDVGNFYHKNESKINEVYMDEKQEEECSFQL